MKTIFTQQPTLDALRQQLVAQDWQHFPDEELQSQDYKAFYWRATVLASLTTYKSVYGDLYVPRSFTVPHESPWPVQAWGHPLGRIVNTLRSHAKRSTNNHDEAKALCDVQREALEQIDFVWDVMEHRWTTRFLPSLQRYYAIYGHSDVPQKFIVPGPDSEDPDDFNPWADLPHCHGYPLGAAVNRLRCGESFTVQLERDYDKLVAIEFPFSSFDINWNGKVLPALEAFFEVYGHINVGQYFVVPVNDPQWPQATWGTRLGFIVQNIRSRGDFFPQLMRDSDRLEEIGFVWNLAEVKWRHMVMPALEAFVEVNDHANVPPNFTVPSNAPWPEAAYNLRLGRIVAMDSARQRFASYIELDQKRLEDLGFAWTPEPRDDVDDVIDSDQDDGHVDDGSSSSDSDDDE